MNTLKMIELVQDYWWLILLLALWSLTWKGLALWRAGRQQAPIWFVILLLVNTLGLLEIIYLSFSANRRSSERSE